MSKGAFNSYFHLNSSFQNARKRSFENTCVRAEVSAGLPQGKEKQRSRQQGKEGEREKRGPKEVGNKKRYLVEVR
jgi:hypothetical protein